MSFDKRHLNKYYANIPVLVIIWFIVYRELFGSAPLQPTDTEYNITVYGLAIFTIYLIFGPIILGLISSKLRINAKPLRLLLGLYPLEAKDEAGLVSVHRKSGNSIFDPRYLLFYLLSLPIFALVSLFLIPKIFGVDTAQRESYYPYYFVGWNAITVLALFVPIVLCFLMPLYKRWK